MPDTQDLNPDLSTKLNDLLAAVKAQGGSPTITSGYRSYQQQEQLYNSGNGGVPVAKPGSSLHEQGLAADVAGDEKTTQLLHSLAPQFGLAFPFTNDPVHVQLANAQAGHNPVATGGTASGAPTAAATGPLPLMNRLAYISQALGLQPTNAAIAAPNTSVVGTPDTSTVGAPNTSLVAPTASAGASSTMAPSSADQQLQPAAAPGSTTAAMQASGSEASPSGNYAALFNEMGQKYGVSPALLSAVAKQESGFDPNAKSGAGATGLMQLMPGTAHGLGVDPTNPIQSVDGAARLLSGYLKQYGGDVSKSLAAYNAGPGAVAHYNGVPPYAETQHYVNSIMATLGSSGGND